MKRLKKTALAAAMASCLMLSGCLGPNRAFEGLRDWNQEVSEQDWVNEVLFIGMNLIPVYPIAYLGDILIFNTIEYWGGSNPIGE